MGRDISIHALLAESDNPLKAIIILPKQFLSTLSLRRATPRREFYKERPGQFLSTLSLRRATSGYFRFSRLDAISIHALLAESDINTYHRIFGEGISIHALLAESDPSTGWKTRPPPHFYPRSPCGERRA